MDDEELKKPRKRRVKKQKAARKRSHELLAVASEPALKPAPPKAKEATPLATAPFWHNWKRWSLLAVGMALVIGGFALASLWSQNRENMVLTIGVMVLFGGGGYLVYLAIKKTGEAVVIVSGGHKVLGPVNSLNIYARKDEATGQAMVDRVAFEWVENPMGQPQQCTKNGKWYHVHIWDIEANVLKPFTLPDSQYFDPREFANVIKMPAHRKLFERQASLLQKIAPWVMVIAFLIAIIGFVATTPTGG